MVPLQDHHAEGYHRMRLVYTVTIQREFLRTILLILDNCMYSLTKPFGNYSRMRYEIFLRGNYYRS